MKFLFVKTSQIPCKNSHFKSMHYTVEGILCQDYICLRKSSSLFRCLVFQQLTLVIYIKNYFGLDSSHESAFFFRVVLIETEECQNGTFIKAGGDLFHLL